MYDIYDVCSLKILLRQLLVCAFCINFAQFMQEVWYGFCLERTENLEI